MVAAIGAVFGVDWQFIADGTYRVTEHDGKQAQRGVRHRQTGGTCPAHIDA
jgi:hypothetical protein